MVMVIILLIMRSVIVMMTVLIEMTIKVIKMRTVILSLLTMQGVKVIWRAHPRKMIMTTEKKKKPMR